MAGDQIVSWYMSDCVAGNQAEIGIYTPPEYRRQGIRTIAAAVEYCLNSGVESVGLHCNDDNIAAEISYGDAYLIGSL
jgi:RimJ/RimL family protein N-acetyltransferase